MIAVGSSTGGVEAIEELLSGIPSDFSPIVIVQHMPALFTSSLARRLDAKSDLSIREARSGEVLKKGDVRIAPGGQMHLMVVREEGGYVTRLVPGEPVSGHRPSVDVMFDSVAQIAERETVGVILTGMGADGAKGLLAMRRAGAVTFAQDRGTSLVYGMPRVAAEMGAANRILPLCEIAPAIVRLDVNMR